MPNAGGSPAADSGAREAPASERSAGGAGPEAGRSRQLVEQLFRHSAGRIVATLARVLGPARLDVAEEAVQEALLRALQRWPYSGVPDNPAGWLFQVARNSALDRVRHDDVVRARLPLLLPPERMDEPGTDDELALMFLCCHPGLPVASQVVLTLRTVGGLGVGEIGAALLTRPATVAQRLVRAKRWLRDNDSLLDVDPSRVDSVLAVLYLLFNAGYDAVEGDSAVRGELCGEAIRLCRLLRADRRTDLPRTRALLALMLLQGSRLRARTDPDGDVLLLSDQDRTRWDQGMIAEGTRTFASSCTGDERSAFHVEAAIALCHAMAPDVERTDWARVVTLYDDLLVLRPSPVAALNRAIAAAMVGDVDHREFERLEREPALRDYHLLPAALGALWLRAGEPETAAAYYRTALTKQTSAPTRRFLERQLDRCLNHPPG
ncbi:RNA polymerase sigma factor [Actinophytocola sp.]|uniref:RNA polymerase sigma factor n=1 Tax=Actinophytocola sp. TaxID=1872138 RepID=UPI003D6A9378